MPASANKRSGMASLSRSPLAKPCIQKGQVHCKAAWGLLHTSLTPEVACGLSQAAAAHWQRPQRVLVPARPGGAPGMQSPRRAAGAAAAPPAGCPSTALEWGQPLQAGSGVSVLGASPFLLGTGGSRAAWPVPRSPQGPDGCRARQCRRLHHGMRGQQGRQGTGLCCLPQAGAGPLHLMVCQMQSPPRGVGGSGGGRTCGVVRAGMQQHHCAFWCSPQVGQHALQRHARLWAWGARQQGAGDGVEADGEAAHKAVRERCGAEAYLIVQAPGLLLIVAVLLDLKASCALSSGQLGRQPECMCSGCSWSSWEQAPLGKIFR